MYATALASLTIFYTYQIGGDLQLLPRLYSFLQQLKAQYDAKALLLDLGAACVPGVWHCDVTGGRSTLIVMDGMGYHAANVSGYLATGERRKLQSNISTGLVDAQHSWRYAVPPVRDEGIIVSSKRSPALTLCLIAAAAAATRLDKRSLHLQAVDKGEVGIVQLSLRPSPTITHRAMVAMPAQLKPDATIAATVEFVQDEARYYQNKI